MNPRTLHHMYQCIGPIVEILVIHTPDLFLSSNRDGESDVNGGGRHGEQGKNFKKGSGVD